MNMKEEKQAAADMCARAAVALRVVIDLPAAHRAAPEVRGEFQDLQRLFSYLYLYNNTLATGAPSDIEKWRRDRARIRAEANETLQKFLEACPPSLGTGPRLDEIDRQHQAEPEHMVEDGVGQ